MYRFKYHVAKMNDTILCQIATVSIQPIGYIVIQYRTLEINYLQAIFDTMLWIDRPYFKVI